MAEAVYRREGDLYCPSSWAGGPWSAKNQHGGPVNALIARAVTQAAAEAGLQPVHMSIELLGPVPLQPLQPSYRIAYRSRRIAFVDAELALGSRIVARGRAQLLKKTDRESPRAWTQREATLPGPEGLEEFQLIPDSRRAELPLGFHLSLGVRMVPEQSSGWLTTPLDLVEGEAISDFERAAALADLTGAIIWRSRAMEDPDALQDRYINVDTHLQIERVPEGAWIGIEKRLLSDRTGVRSVTAWLHDGRGRFGSSQQSLLANPA